MERQAELPNECCIKCRFWDGPYSEKDGQPEGLCLRNPPAYSDGVGLFPSVFDTNWCGEFSSKIAAKPNSDAILEGSIQDANFSIRVRRALVRLGVETIGQLCDKTEDDLRSMDGFGDGSLREVSEYLSRRGLTLKPLHIRRTEPQVWLIRERGEWREYCVSIPAGGDAARASVYARIEGNQMVEFTTNCPPCFAEESK